MVEVGAGRYRLAPAQRLALLGSRREAPFKFLGARLRLWTPSKMEPQALEARLQSLEARLEEMTGTAQADGNRPDRTVEVIEAQVAHMDMENQQVLLLARDLRVLTMALICLARLLEVTKVAPADAGASAYDAVIKELSMEDRRRMSVVLPLLAGWAQSPSPE